jgi:adenosyl cobinamide kinase/adenosyl cobinamide phosphate guanylyltransferase
MLKQGFAAPATLIRLLLKCLYSCITSQLMSEQQKHKQTQQQQQQQQQQGRRRAGNTTAADGRPMVLVAEVVGDSGRPFFQRATITYR